MVDGLMRLWHTVAGHLTSYTIYTSHTKYSLYGLYHPFKIYIGTKRNIKFMPNSSMVDCQKGTTLF